MVLHICLLYNLIVSIVITLLSSLRCTCIWNHVWSCQDGKRHWGFSNEFISCSHILKLVSGSPLCKYDHYDFLRGTYLFIKNSYNNESVLWSVLQNEESHICHSWNMGLVLRGDRTGLVAPTHGCFGDGNNGELFMTIVWKLFCNMQVLNDWWFVRLWNLLSTCLFDINYMLQ